MIKVIAKEAALKVFYFLMSVDGVTTFEQERFKEIGVELLGDPFYKEEERIIAECEGVIRTAKNIDDRYGVISESVSRVLNWVVPKIDEGVVPRLLVWNMLTLAHSDSDYSQNEDRLISYVAELLKIDKSVLAEMKHLISVAHSVQGERELLQKSTRPYTEIRPIIDEIENREKVIVEAAKALIADDVVLDGVGRKEGHKATPSAKTAREKAAKGFRDTGAFVGGKAIQGAGTLKSGAGKLFSKVKDTSKKT